MKTQIKTLSLSFFFCLLFSSAFSNVEFPVIADSIKKNNLNKVDSTLLNYSNKSKLGNWIFKNLYDSTLGYSDNIYNLQLATRNGVIYPSYDH